MTIAILAIVLAAIVLILVVLSSLPGFLTGNVVNEKEVSESAIVVKFDKNPEFYETGFFDYWGGNPRVLSNLKSVNNLLKKYDADSFNQLFKQTRLENTYEIKMKKGSASEMIKEFKANSDVEYARVSKPDFENKIRNEIDKINRDAKGEWTADYTLQSIMSDEDRLLLVNPALEADVGAGKGGGGRGKGGGKTKTTCTDSDGTNYSIKGNVYTCVGSNCTSPVYDYCIDDKTIGEYYCSGGGIYLIRYAGCSSCKDGVCIIIPANYTYLPRYFDWRNASRKNYITPVKNQASCGSCWAFGVASAFEGEINAYYNTLVNVDLSEQDLVSCSSSGSCSGGSPVGALSYIKGTGVTGESCFEYTATNNLCSNKCASWQSSAWKISSWTAESTKNDSIRKALFEKGPLAIEMSVYSDFMSYGGGIYRQTSQTYVGGHEVALVGYGYDSNNNLYWIVKNSWGTGWGESGFFRIYAGTSQIAWSAVSIESPIPPIAVNVTCEDEDNDGYCNWGLGSKPLTCPACSEIRDCNDVNPSIRTSCG